MVVCNIGKPPSEDPLYERFILRKKTFIRPDSPIFLEENLVENIFQCFNVPEQFKEEEGHEMLEEILWDLCTERSP